MTVLHWHVDTLTSADEDGPFITTSARAAFEYAAEELGRAADFEQERISALGDAGDFEGAYRAFQRTEALSAAQQNAENIARQYAATHENDRAPLYRGDGWRERLAESAEHVRFAIADASAVRIWACGHPDVPVTALRPGDVFRADSTRTVTVLDVSDVYRPYGVDAVTVYGWVHDDGATPVLATMDMAPETLVDVETRQD